MTNKILLIIVFLVSSTVIYGQCKIKTKGSIVKLIERRVPIDVEKLTKPKVLFDKYFTVATCSFVKSTSGDHYLVIPFSRAHSARFNISENTPLKCYLEEGVTVSLDPPELIEGKMVITTLQIFLYYKVSEFQIDELAKNHIVNMRIYFMSEKDISNTFEDDLGRYFEFEILSENNKAHLLDAANCILQN